MPVGPPASELSRPCQWLHRDWELRRRRHVRVGVHRQRRCRSLSSAIQETLVTDSPAVKQRDLERGDAGAAGPSAGTADTAGPGAPQPRAPERMAPRDRTAVSLLLV